jgi:hypothetical protein
MKNYNVEDKAKIAFEGHRYSDAELKSFFVWFLNNREKRIDQLLGLVRSIESLSDWAPDKTPDSLRGLSRFFAQIKNEAAMMQPYNGPTSVTVRKNEGSFKIPLNIQQILSPFGLSVVFDSGIYFGETLIKQIPSTHWKLLLDEGPRTASRLADHGMPVITGAVDATPLRNSHVGLQTRNIFRS